MSKRSKKKQAPARSPLPAIIAAIVAMGAIAAFIITSRSTAPTAPRKENAAASTNVVADSTNAAPIGEILTAPEEPDEAVARLITEGNDALERGKTDQALAAYRKAVETKPDDEDAHFNLGIALARSGKTNEAKLEYEKALEIFPDYPEAHNNLGNLLMRENKLPEAIAHFEAAIKATPENPSAHNNLGTALAKQGKFAEAALKFAEAIRLQPDYFDARVNIAQSYTSLGRYEEAARELDTVLRIDPSNKAAQRALQNLRVKSGQ